MKTIKRLLKRLFTALIALVAVANLAALFLFDYQMPSVIPETLTKIGLKETELQTEPELMEADPEVGELSLEINVPTQPLNYNGSGNFNPLDGVKVQYVDGMSANDTKVDYDISEGSSRLEKVITYTVTDAYGVETTATRVLKLGRRYTGPTITLSTEITDLSDDEIDTLKETLIENNQIHAEDGFGNDITSSVRVKTKTNEDDEIISVTFRVKNKYGDRFDLDFPVTVNSTGVVMKLTCKETTIHVGDGFSFYQYIKDCHDAAGNDLHYNISVKGSVDTYTPGVYVLEIYCNDANGVSSPHKTLTVNVVQ